MAKKANKGHNGGSRGNGKGAGERDSVGRGARSDVLPLPEAPFRGRIGTVYTDSEPDVPDLPGAPAGAPNVLLVLLEDLGFGDSSVFGGPVDMPTLQRLADQGLRYNRFHTTALCSPTRAALLTGRNHHAVHTGTIMELASGYPGYDGRWPREVGCVAETLRQNGYSTAVFGKWHNTPDYEISAAGPFDRWPTGLGFDRFWGFIGGEASQWHTPLYENTSPIETPHEPGWHFSEALADHAISWIGQQKAAAPGKPFFCYVAPGCAHAPHHVAREWADKYRGKFDHGWDRQRELTLERQKSLGVVPQDTTLTPRPSEIPSWDSRSADEKRLYTRMQEVFAGFLEHCDAQIGRIVDALEVMGVRDDTLIIYVVGDNGASAEGTLTGTLNNVKTMQGYPDDVAKMLGHIDEIGGPKFENNYPVGWCWAGSSPLQWMKQVSSHFGGTRNPVVMSWPNGIRAIGGIRQQFHHAIDIVPTILEASGIPQPREVNGVTQRPLDGVSMAYTWDDASAVGRRVTQYFEMFGNRAIYHDGWVAGCRHGRIPWDATSSGSFDHDVWELYDVRTDFSQSEDLAKKHPDVLRRLQDLFLVEAAKNQVFPLDDRFAERADLSFKPSFIRGEKHFVFVPGTERIYEPVSPNTKNVNHTLAADIDVPAGGAEGVLVCCGGESGGYTLFMQGGHLHWEHNWFGEERYRVSSTQPIPSGRHMLSATITVDREGQPGVGGEVVLRLGEKVIGKGRFEKQIPYRFTVNETFDVGCDTITPVSDRYESPYRFTGTIRRVVLDLSGKAFEDLAAQVKIALAIQ